MHVLVTGGAGFIGSHLVDRLVSEKHWVTVVDDLSTGSRGNVHPKVTFLKVDIRNLRDLEQAVLNALPDVISHHAGQASLRQSVKFPGYDAHVNIVGSVNLIRLAAKYRVRHFIYSSSGGAVYGEPRELPVSEDHPTNPCSPYGLAKLTVERYLELYRQLEGLRCTVLRYPNVFGPRQDPAGEAGVVAIFSEQMLRGERPVIFGKGNKTRDYVYVDDIVDANIRVMQAGGDRRVYNLGSGREVSDYEIFTRVREAVGVDVEPRYELKRPGEITRICLSYEKAKAELGWEPRCSLVDGVQKAVAFYRDKLVAENVARESKPSGAGDA